MKVFHSAVLLLIVFINLNEIDSAPADVDNSKTVAVYNKYNLNPDGNYNYKYKLCHGQAVDVEGLHTFEGTDGKVYSINYTADENGYRTSSDNVPAAIITSTLRPPPTPSTIPPAPSPVKPDDEDEINPRTIAGTFG